MNTRKRVGSFLVALGLVAANLIVFNWISLSNFARIDLTRDKLYTLHPATVELLHGLDDLVTLTVYLSEKRFAENQGYSQIPRTVRDMVEEFVARSDGKVKAAFVDPTDEPELEAKAEAAGILSVRVTSTDRDQAKQFKAFVGIVLSYGGKEDLKIPVAYFQSEEYRLELELALAIARLTRREVITIGVNSVNELPEGIPPQLAAQMGQNQDKYDLDQFYPLLKQELTKLYEVEKVSVMAPIPEHVTLLILANTEGLDDKAKYHIDQYLMRGGQMVVLAAGVDFDQRMRQPVARTTDNDEFFRHYGFTIDKNMILDRQAVSPSPFAPPLYWAPTILPSSFNAESALMAGIPAFALPFASAIHLNPPPGVSATVLATTTGLAWQQTGFFTIDDTTAQANPPENADEYKTFDVVGLLEGEFESYFTNRALPEGVGTAVKEPSAADFTNPGEEGDDEEDHTGHDHGGTTPPPAQGGGNGGDLPQEGGNPPAPAPVIPNTPAVQDPAAQAGAPPSTAPANAQPTFVKAKSPKTKIIVIGSNFFLFNQFLQQVPGNAEFFLTLVERLTTGSRLGDLRNRTVQRPSIKGDLSATTQATIKWFGILGMPALVAAFGIVWWMLRTKRGPGGVTV